jgi:hypothetical protein
LYFFSKEETRVIVETSPMVRGAQKKVLQKAFELVDSGNLPGALDQVQTVRNIQENLD